MARKIFLFEKPVFSPRQICYTSGMKKNEILIIHGTAYRDMTKQLLEAAHLADMIGSKEKKIALKPNLVNASSPSYGATTHTELAAGVIQYLWEHGFSDITIMESSWVGEKTERAFYASGFDHLCEAYQIPFADLQQDGFRVCDAAGMIIIQYVKFSFA